jgi:phage shock protein C
VIPQTTRTLYRSRTHRMFLGVAGGIADYFSIDPTVVRVIWVIGALVMAPMTAPAALVLYLVLGLFVPEAPRE